MTRENRLSSWCQSRRKMYGLAEEIDCNLLSFVGRRHHEAVSPFAPPGARRRKPVTRREKRSCAAEAPNRVATSRAALQRPRRVRAAPPAHDEAAARRAAARAAGERQGRLPEGIRPAQDRAGCSVRLAASRRAASAAGGARPSTRSVAAPEARDFLTDAHDAGIVSVVSSPLGNAVDRHGEIQSGSLRRKRIVKKRKEMRNASLKGFRAKKRKEARHTRKRRKRAFVELPSGSHFDELIRSGAFEKHMAQVRRR